MGKRGNNKNKQSSASKARAQVAKALDSAHETARAQSDSESGMDNMSEHGRGSGANPKSKAKNSFR